MQAEAGEPRELLRVDSAMPMLLHLLVPLARPFRARYPRLELELLSSEGYINLIERRVDVAIRAGTLQDSALHARHLFDSRRRLVAPAYLAQRPRPTTVADLACHRLLGLSEPKSLNQWPFADRGTRAQLVEPQLTSNSGEVLRQLCLQGNGIACLSDFMVDADIATGRLIELLADRALPLALPFHAVYYGDGAPSPKIRAFVDFLRERLGPATSLQT